ncbi:MAG: hypothetical protein KGJ49_04345 [Alphaproteobacteria bacterium]|nr:hypothetical protein [Alphaproteobacteria bacterium]
MMLVLEIAGGVVLGGIAFLVFANWTREVMGILGVLVFVAGVLLALMIDPSSLILFVIGGIGWFLYKRHAERRAQLEEDEARNKAGTSERQRRASRLAELEATQKVRTLNLGEWSQYQQLKREHDETAS